MNHIVKITPSNFDNLIETHFMALISGKPVTRNLYIQWDRGLATGARIRQLGRRLTELKEDFNIARVRADSHNLEEEISRGITKYGKSYNVLLIEAVDKVTKHNFSIINQLDTYLADNNCSYDLIIYCQEDINAYNTELLNKLQIDSTMYHVTQDVSHVPYKLVTDKNRHIVVEGSIKASTEDGFVFMAEGHKDWLLVYKNLH